MRYCTESQCNRSTVLVSRDVIAGATSPISLTAAFWTRWRGGCNRRLRQTSQYTLQ